MTEVTKNKKKQNKGKNPCNSKPINKRKAISDDDVPAVVQGQINAATDEQKAKFFGVAGKKRVNFDAPQFFSLESEHVIHNGNAWIVLGYDRENFNPTSGQGGLGRPRCASIDLVVGRGGYNAASHNTEGTPNTLGPNFTTDAARIFISQMSDPDSYFAPDNGKLPKGKLTETSTDAPLSVVGMKADVVRVVARENIKLVTRTDQLNAQGGKCSSGQKGRYGISLVAMNGEGPSADVQPMVKGDNLVSCLKAIIVSMNNHRMMLINLAQYVRTFQQVMMTHKHLQTATPGVETAPDFGAMQDIVQGILDTALDVEVPAKMDALMENNALINDWLSDEGGVTVPDKYILSKYNFAN
jgi:hypothetical protein